MTSSPSLSSASARRRFLPAVLAAACALGIATPASAAARPVKYVPVYVPLVVINCPKLNLNLFKARPQDRGYLPALGHAALRWVDAPPAPRAVEPPPVVLYNPPAEPVKTPATETAKTPPAEANPGDTATPEAPKKLRAEDFLPYFEGPGELRGAVGDVDGGTFVPARPVLPESRADYRQK